jgi:hypothetical protein
LVRVLVGQDPNGNFQAFRCRVLDTFHFVISTREFIITVHASVHVNDLNSTDVVYHYVIGHFGKGILPFKIVWYEILLHTP